MRKYQRFTFEKDDFYYTFRKRAFEELGTDKKNYEATDEFKRLSWATLILWFIFFALICLIQNYYLAVFCAVICG